MDQRQIAKKPSILQIPKKDEGITMKMFTDTNII